MIRILKLSDAAVFIEGRKQTVESVSEAVLRPGDTVQVGVVQIKFEAGIKRPKLQAPTAGLRKAVRRPVFARRLQDSA